MLRDRLLAWRSDLALPNRQPALDGVRGLAALIVVSSHTNFLGLSGQGSVGVWLFFCLSGYLLSQPFLTDPALTPQRYVRFLFDRCRRILPAYWVAVMVFYGPAPGPGVEQWIPNLLLIRADWHLWSVKQEMILYLVLPFVLAALPLFKRRLVLFAAFCVLAGATLHLFLGPEVFVTDQDRQMRLYALPFMLGIAVAALSRSPWFGLVKQRALAGALGDAGLLAFAAILLLSAPNIYQTILSALAVPFPVGALPGWQHYEVFAFVCAAFLLSTLLRGRLALTALTWPPLRACGVLGYSIYLIHYFVVLLLPASLPEGGFRFAATMAITFPLACVMYGFVERTFWKPASSKRPVSSAARTEHTAQDRAA